MPKECVISAITDTEGKATLPTVHIMIGKLMLKDSVQIATSKATTRTKGRRSNELKLCPG